MEQGKAYLAIDPGSKGCIAIQSDKGREYYFICELNEKINPFIPA